MPIRTRLRVCASSVALSTIAPVILAANGVADRDLLLIVFVPSVLVGWTTGSIALRGRATPPTWAFDTKRMP